MFGRKKHPVLTATTCGKLENARQAMEVLTGKLVRLIQFDFNTGYGKAKVGGEEKDIAIDFAREDLIIWRFTDVNEWYRSFIIEETGEVEVICDENPHKRGKQPMWWIGKSAIERYESPLFRKELQREADKLGLSLEAYLRLDAGETWPLEAQVTVGSTKLNQSQSMAVRVAVNNMLMQLQDPKEREALGEIAGAYEDRLREVGTIFLKEMSKQ